MRRFRDIDELKNYLLSRYRLEKLLLVGVESCTGVSHVRQASVRSWRKFIIFVGGHDVNNLRVRSSILHEYAHLYMMDRKIQPFTTYEDVRLPVTRFSIGVDILNAVTNPITEWYAHTILYVGDLDLDYYKCTLADVREMVKSWAGLVRYYSTVRQLETISTLLSLLVIGRTNPLIDEKTRRGIIRLVDEHEFSGEIYALCERLFEKLSTGLELGIYPWLAEEILRILRVKLRVGIGWVYVKCGETGLEDYVPVLTVEKL